MRTHQAGFQLEPSSYLRGDTIAAAITAVGGPVAGIRVSGSKSWDIIAKVFSERLEDRKSQIGRVRAQGRDIDQVVVVGYRGPRSFTGEDAVEIFCHGNAIVVREILDLLLSLGAKGALPGEFSFRAVKNGRMELQQASAVSNLINAKTTPGARAALAGALGKDQGQVKKLRQDFETILATVEASIDFSDQDIGEENFDAMKSKTQELLVQLAELSKSYARSRTVFEGVVVGFIGAPNAGKSSLFNALLGYDRAIVSSLPGTTRDTVSESVLLQARGLGAIFTLVDAAGIRRARDINEKRGVKRAEHLEKNADVVLWHLPFGSRNQKFWAQVKGRERDKIGGIVVVTKEDLSGKKAHDKWRKSVAARAAKMGVRVVYTSAKKRSGMEPLIDAIFETSGIGLESKNNLLLTSRLQWEALEKGIKSLSRASRAGSIDLMSADLRQAAAHLGPVLGIICDEDVLGRIFSSFCIGK